VLIGKILKVRLIEPLQRVGSALTKLSDRDYTARVPVDGNDEVTQLARAINSTIQTTEAYTRELEFRRKDADRALQDADEANLLRDGLIRSLTDDFEGPLNHMHAELTAIAMANQDLKLRDRIKSVIALLQDAQSDFADLMEIATSAQDPRKSAAQNLAALLDDVRVELQRLSELEKKPIHFGVSLPGEQGGARPERNAGY
jgi:HAMP domain-containing protein